MSYDCNPVARFSTEDEFCGYHCRSEADGEGQVCIEVEDGLKVGCNNHASKEEDAGNNKFGAYSKMFHGYLLLRFVKSIPDCDDIAITF
jgi:hypothetical protein